MAHGIAVAINGMSINVFSIRIDPLPAIKKVTEQPPLIALGSQHRRVGGLGGHQFSPSSRVTVTGPARCWGQPTAPEISQPTSAVKGGMFGPLDEQYANIHVEKVGSEGVSAGRAGRSRRS